MTFSSDQNIFGSILYIYILFFLLNLFLINVLYILSKVTCPDTHFEFNQQFFLEDISLTLNLLSSSKTRIQHQKVFRFSIPTDSLSFSLQSVIRMIVPVSRYTVQDKPLFVITTIQNRISQTVCTSIEHTIELDIWTENTKSSLMVWRHPSDKNNDMVVSFSSSFF